MKNYLDIIIFSLLLVSCTPSTTQDQKEKIDENEKVGTNLSSCDKLYVDTWESESITEDDVDVTDQNPQTYLRITKPDNCFRLEVKYKRDNEFKKVGNLYVMFGNCSLIMQTEKPRTIERLVFYYPETDKIKFQGTPYVMGMQAKGVGKIIYHRLK